MVRTKQNRLPDLTRFQLLQIRSDICMEDHQPPLVGWFVIEVAVEHGRAQPLYASVRGPYPTEERAEKERDAQQEAWEDALDEWEGENPYDFKGWQIERVLLRDFMMEKLEREDRESFETRREAAAAVGASMLAEEGIGPLADEQSK